MNVQLEGPNAKLYAALAEDEVELLSMLGAMYHDYWKNGDDSLPREEHSEGNYWAIEYRVHRMGDGTPSLEKEIYFKNADGSRIKTRDNPPDEFEGDVPLADGVSRARCLAEEVAFLGSAIESSHRSYGDLTRIETAMNNYVGFRNSRPGRELRRQIEAMYQALPDTVDYRLVNEWKIIEGVDDWEVSKAELHHAMDTESEQLALPPWDGGRPRFVDKNEGDWPRQPEGSAVPTLSAETSLTDPRIKFG